ncbi:MAG: hypothetical protein ACK55I_49650, partial [bacterium]
ALDLCSAGAGREIEQLKAESAQDEVQVSVDEPRHGNRTRRQVDGGGARSAGADHAFRPVQAVTIARGWAPRGNVDRGGCGHRPILEA